MDPGSDLLAADADAAARADQAADFDDGAWGQRPGRQGGGREWPCWLAAGGAQPGQVGVGQGDGVGLDQLAVMEHVHGATVEADGDFLPGERLAEPDLAPSARTDSVLQGGAARFPAWLGSEQPV